MTEPSSMASDSDQAHDQDAPSKRAAPPVLLDDERPGSPLQKRPGSSPRQTGNLIPPPVNRLATSVPPSSPSSASSSSSPPRRVSAGGPDEVIDLCGSDTDEESDNDNELRDSHRGGRAPRSTGVIPVAEERAGPMTSTPLAARQGTSRPMAAPVKAEEQAVDDDETEDEMELHDVEASGMVAAADSGTAASGSSGVAPQAPLPAGGLTVPTRFVPQDGYPSLRVELPTTAGASSGTALSAAALPFPDGPETRTALHDQHQAPPALDAARASRPHVAEGAAAPVPLASSPSSATSTGSSTSPQEHLLARILEKTQERMLTTRPQPRRSPSKQLRRSQPSAAEAPLRGLGAQAGPSGASGPLAQGPGGDRLEQDSTSGRSTPNLPLKNFNSPPPAQPLAPPKRSTAPVSDSLGRLGAGTATGDSATPQDKRPALGGGGGAMGPCAPLQPRSTAPKPLQRASLPCGPSPQHLAKQQKELATHLLPRGPHELGAQPLLLGESRLFPGLGATVQASGPRLQQLPQPQLPTRVQPVGGPARVPSGPSVPAVATSHEYLRQHLRDLEAKLKHHWPDRHDLPLVFTLLEGTVRTATEVEGSATSLDLVNTNVCAVLEHLRAFLDEEPRKAEEERRRGIEGIVSKAGEWGIKGFSVGNAMDKLQKLRHTLRAYLPPQPGEDMVKSECAKAKKALEATREAAKQARLLYDMAPIDTKWKFREGVDKVLKEVDKCSTALTAVERKRRHLSFIQAVTPLAPHLDSGSQRGRGGDVASLQADLLGVWDLWNRLRTAVLARAEGPGLSMLLVYDMRCGAHKVDSSHLECPQRLDLAKAALEALAQRHPQVYTLQPTLPPNCPYYPLYDPAFHTYRTEVLRVHREHYLERLRKLCEGMDPGRLASLSKVEDQGDTMGCSKSFDAASVAFAATLEAVDAVMSRRAHAAFVACRPPGHHAGRCGEPEDDESLGLGFCLLNYAAAAAKHVRSQWQCARVSVIDIDLHHGNGTQEILCASHDHSYQFISIHADDMFPHTGARDPTREPFVVNLPIPGNVNSSTFREKQRDVEAAVREFRPDFIIVSAGFDAHKNDPIRDSKNDQLVQRGHLTAADYRDFGVLVKRLATELCLGRVVAILEGGYSVGCQGVGYSDGAVGGEQENLGHCVSALARGMGMGGGYKHN